MSANPYSLNKALLPVSLVILLSGCASKAVFDGENFSDQVTPGQVVEDSAQWINSQVLWGGVIISTRNLQDSTQLEVLAYPLDSKQRPRQNQSAMGRFIAQQADYLEPVDYAPGRLITIAGSISGTQQGQVGDATAIYPVVRASQHELWTKSSLRDGPEIHFGFGFIFGG